MAISPPAPRWQRVEHDERRRQTIARAGRLVSEGAYASVSNSEIARQAGLFGDRSPRRRAERDLYLEVVSGAVTAIDFHEHTRPGGAAAASIYRKAA